MVRHVIAVVAVTLVLAACAGASKDGTTVAQVGAAAPSWSDPLVGGGTFDSSQLHGSPVFMDFFATWCPPCNAEAPKIDAAYREYAPQGLRVVGVDVQETAAKAKEFVAEHHLTYPAVVDAGTLSDAYQINGMPVGVFIDKTGVVRRIVVGEMTRAQLDANVKAIL